MVLRDTRKCKGAVNICPRLLARVFYGFGDYFTVSTMVVVLEIEVTPLLDCAVIVTV
jgi:hypothetical protein